MKDKNTILIVDDDTSNLMELTHILRDEYKIYAVKNGKAAITKARESLPDLILLDVIMPDMDGFNVFYELKNIPETTSIPVIFITGLDEYESRGLGVGAVDYIKKPFDPGVVKLRVNNQIKIINLQYRLQNAVETAQAANKSKSAFLANMSHEIRTPMNAIMGIVNILLSKKSLPEDIIDALKRINSSSHMLLDIVNDILDLTQIESGKLKINPIRYDVVNMINDVVDLNIIRIKKKPIEFKLIIDEDTPNHLIGDVLRIKQILSNLLSNAFKYTEEGHVTLTVACESHDDGIFLVLDVCDTGCGMSVEQLNKSFETYSRFTTERSGVAIEGTGLGLAITQHLVNLMGAEIKVESELEKGTRFSVRIPQKTVDTKVLGKNAINNTDSKPHDGIYEPMPHGRVLVVDDVELNLYVASGVLEPYGLKIDLASSGLEAIESIEAGNVYDIIFMDYMMPVLNGVETTKRLRGMGYIAPIVALTADIVSGNEEMFIENGFSDFISKPINAGDINKVILRYIK
jgi:signal transduction histidine kinase